MTLSSRAIFRKSTGIVAAAIAALWMATSVAVAFDETKYPDWSGQWRRKPGANANSWDETKRPGRPQNPPLTAEYQAFWDASMADQAAGGQGADYRVRCISNGMPRLMTVVRIMGFVIRPEMTYVIFENNIPRWIWTDGRSFTGDEDPTFAGYSIGKWLDTDGDGIYDTLDVETRAFKGPRNYEPTGIPLHPDNQSVVKERLWLDKGNKDVLHNEITVIDHALTQPWTVTKDYYRTRKVEWHEDLCTENNNHVMVGKDDYFLSGDGYLMPTKKDQPPPDLRYFKQTTKK
jgi:hypothetical protein